MNPVLEAWRRRRRNRRRALGLVQTALGVAAPIAASVLLTPLLAPVFLVWLGGPRSTWGSRLAEAAYVAVIAGIDGQDPKKRWSALQL